MSEINEETLESEEGVAKANGRKICAYWTVPYD